MPDQQPLQWQDVASSNVGSVAYEERARRLHVRFLTGGYYVYLGVSKLVYDNMIGASSKGKFLNARIKPYYRFEKLR